MSPVSDTTNLSALSVEIPVYEHIKGMLPNVIGAGVITVIIFFIMGATNTKGITELTPEALNVLKSLTQMCN